MNRRLPVALPLLCALAACTSEATVGHVEGAIVGGVETSRFPAVGVLAVRVRACGEVPVVGVCTATLIAPDRALTAGHCVAPYHDGQLELRFGHRLDDPEAERRVVVAATLHPLYDESSSDHDLAVLRLDRPASPAPMALFAGDLDSAFVGSELTLVGYGATAEQAILSREGRTVVDSLDPFTFRFSASPALTCHGDSGGPALVDGVDGPEIVGVTSAGDVDCASYGVDVRVDSNRDFILAAVAEPGPMVDSRPTLDALCEATCEVDAECPAALICRSDDAGLGRCVLPQREPGRFSGACMLDADCGSGTCASLPDGCRCYEPCAVPNDDAGLDAAVDAAPDGGSGGGGGCAVAGVDAAGAWTWLVASVVLVCRRRRGFG